MKSYILFCLFTLFSCPISAMEKSEIQIYKANDDCDIRQIIQLINSHAIEGGNKSATQNDATTNRFYVAKDSYNDIIAFNKLFIVTDPQEFTNITEQEIHCAGSESRLVTVQCHIETNIINMFVMPSFSIKDSAIIYYGSDFIHPDYRDEDINSQLMQYALNQVQKNITADVRNEQKNQIILLYGLTKTNARENDNTNRHTSIIKKFIDFAQKVATACKHTGTYFLYHGQYTTFDSKSKTRSPLPDDQAVPGYGNVLLYSFGKEVK